MSRIGLSLWTVTVGRVEPQPNFDADPRAEVRLDAESPLVRPYVAVLERQTAFRAPLRSAAWESVAALEYHGRHAATKGARLRVGALPARHRAPVRFRRPFMVAGLGTVACAVGLAVFAPGVREPTSAAPPDSIVIADPGRGYLATDLSAAVSSAALPAPELVPTGPGAAPPRTVAPGTPAAAATAPTTPGRHRAPAPPRAPGATSSPGNGAAGVPNSTAPAPTPSPAPSECLDPLGVPLADCG
jgi:hypothetical protein